jgi:hypothetical protein
MTDCSTTSLCRSSWFLIAVRNMAGACNSREMRALKFRYDVTLISTDIPAKASVIPT